MRKDIEGYTERRKAVDKREEERKEAWNILEGRKEMYIIEVMEEEGKFRGLRTRKGRKLEEGERDMQKIGERNYTESGMKEESRNNCYKEEAKGLHREQKDEGINEYLY